MITRILLAFVLVLLVATAGFVAWAWYPTLAASEPPRPQSFDKAAIARGATLAALGACETCHTRAGGKPYAGGRPLPTPFGTIYTTNITPDPATGIGGWSPEAFGRALHDGVDRQGRHLYPAFPFDHFTKMDEADVAALYAFFMTRAPVIATPPDNDLIFPLNIRFAVAGWKLLFFHPAGPVPPPNADVDIKRGAYLVQAISHCGACHTPRNWLGAEISSKAFSGGSIEGWDVPALNGASPAPIPWTADQLFAYLQSGYAAYHSRPLGPMAPVTADLSHVPATDIRAIASYIASFERDPSPEQRQTAQARIESAEHPLAVSVKGGGNLGEGAMIYAGACAPCHENRALNYTRSLNLGFSSAVAGPTPRNAIHTILEGIAPPDEQAGPRMPAFASALTDAQVGALVAYLRERFGPGGGWTDIDSEVHKIREGKEKS